ADQVRKAPCNGTANLFTYVSDAAESAAENGEGLGHLPGQPHVHGDSADGACDVHWQTAANLFFFEFANFSHELAVTPVNFGLLSHLKEPLRPRIALSVNAVADPGDELLVTEPLLNGILGDCVEIGLFRIGWQSIV